MTSGRFLRRPLGPMVMLALCGPVFAQAPSRPADLFMTRLQGAPAGGPRQATPQPRPPELQPLPVTTLDDQVKGDLDGTRRISLTVSRPMPLRDLLMLLVNGTRLSLVNDEAVDGTFVGDLKDLTMRQALEAVLFPRGLDYDVQGTLIRVFPRKASTRLFNVNYLNVRRSWQRTIDTSLSSLSEIDPFGDLGKGVEALLSSTGRLHLDRGAGLLQVTDFSDRLDQVGVYVEAVQLRALRQVRIDAHVLEVTFPEGGATSINWNAIAARIGAPAPPIGDRATAGFGITDLESLKNAIGEQGIVTLLAAPRVVAMNNEPAIMRMGSQRQGATVLEGLTLTVIAQVSADGIVQLSVSPTYAASAGAAKAIGSGPFPRLRISEADTLMRVHDGEIMALSGFLADREQPKAATGFSAMFGAQSHTSVKSELVILLKPTIVNPAVATAY